LSQIIQLTPMTLLPADLRFAFRQLRRSPGFAVAAVACLAIGIGASTAVFGFARALLAPSPFVAAPERLARAFVDWHNGLQFGAFSYPDYRDLRDRNRVFSGFAVETPTPLLLGTGGEGERLWGSIASGNYFSVLGVTMALGRGFLPEEDAAPGSRPVAVLSHGLWRRRFGGDPAVVGRAITLNGHPFTVVGVAPPGFTGANAGVETAVWVPMAMQAVAVPGREAFEAREIHWIPFAIGRLKPGVTLAAAQASLNALMATLAEEHPDTDRGATIALYPEAHASLHPYVRGKVAGFLGLLAGAVGLILLLACANVAGLLVARGVARQREMAVRLALGAGRGRLLRQLLAESLVLALGAGAVGLALSLGLARALGGLDLPRHLPLGVHVGLDGRLFAFALAAAVATTCLFGLAPALAATRPRLAAALKEGGGGGRAWRRPGGWLRPGLVVGQVALSLVFLLAAGLALESLANARRIDLGFEPRGQLLAGLDLGLQGYDRARGEEFFRRLRERVETLPGVEAAGYARLVPLSLRTFQTPVEPEGWVATADAAPPSVDYNFIGPGYFTAMGVPRLAGRGFADEDRDLAPPPAVVNETFARRFWGAGPAAGAAAALGKSVKVFGVEHRVAGVVGDGKYFTLGEDPRPYVYLPLPRYYRGDLTLHVRTAGDPAALAAAVRREVAALDPAVAVYDLAPMSVHLRLALLPARLAATVVTAFAAVALLLAAVGLYGVIAFWVGQRRREMAVRLALGAAPREVLALVVRQGMALAGVGLALGLAAGAAVLHLAARLLYGVSAADPGAYVAALAVLAAAALTASLLPARRAVGVDPAAALRAE
jgi:putative ABC transport system permease protein